MYRFFLICLLHPAALYSASYFSQWQDKMLQTNSDIKIEKMDIQKYSHLIVKEEAAFDPNLKLSFKHSRENKPAMSASIDDVTGSTVFTNKETISTTLSKKFTFGPQLNLTFSIDYQDTNKSSELINPKFTNSISFNCDIPVLRFGSDYTAIQIAKNKNLREVEELQALKKQKEKIKGLKESIWDLYLNTKLLEIKKSGLERVRQIQLRTEKKFQAGVISNLENVYAKSKITKYEYELNILENTIARLTHDVGYSIWEADNGAHARELELKDIDPQLLADLNFDFMTEDQIDYNVLQVQQKNSVLDRSKYALEKFPDIRLKPYFSINSQNKNMGSGVLELTRGLGKESVSFGVSLTLAFPIENNAASSSFEKALLDISKKEVSKEKLKLTLQNDFSETVRQLQSSQKNLETQKTIVALSEERLSGELEKYNLGKKSSDDVFKYVDKLESAKTAYFTIQNKYGKLLAKKELFH